jgi:Spy/CpxP family protein refolding chaperone
MHIGSKWEMIIMKKQVLTLATFAFILACGAAFAEEGPGMRDHEGHRMMGCSMMGRGGMMGHGAAMRVIFALMDSDGDGTVSLQEFQAAHEKISAVVAVEGAEDAEEEAAVEAVRALEDARAMGLADAQDA